jgi:hypothetical protein
MIFLFQTTSWWWTGFWMGRQGLIVLGLLIVIFCDQSPTIILTALLVALMLSKILQCAQPIATTPSEESNKYNNNNQGKNDDESSSTPSSY